MLKATQDPQQSQAQEQHILVIDDHDCGVFALDAATYSIGRDANNAIVLNDPSVSRKHALLLRMPIPGESRYRYRLIDGNSDGKPSTNGTIVNGDPCQSHELSKGDSIQFGKNSFCTYLVISGEEADMANYLASAEFQSIKAGQVDPKATVVADLIDKQANAGLWLDEPIEAEQEDMTTIFSKRGAARKAASAASPPEDEPKQGHRGKLAVGLGIGALVLAIGVWQLTTRTPEPKDPNQSEVTTPAP